jgi:molybdopterin synthase sulfur carrier subunit
MAHMKVDVALFAYLADYQPDAEGGRHARAFDLADGTTITNVIASLGLPDQPRVVFLNNRHATEDAVLHEGDRLAIFPPIAGG